jgi:hypothetical protein
MHLPYQVLGLMALVLIFLLYRIVQLFNRIKKCEYEVYVNTAGITSNPPRFIELTEGKTINFRLGKEVVSISQISFNKGMETIERIQNLFTILSERIGHQPENEADKIKHNFLKINTYNLIVKEIYELSKPFARSKGKLKKELYKRAKKDTLFIMRICEQVLDYWIYVGKYTALLSKGKTLRQTFGGDATWNSINWDTTGKIDIRPRYG